MEGPDYPQDERPGTGNNVPGLIHDYRAQRDAWREQARNLARMREEVLTAADREAKDIVSTARADVRRILLKARRDLLVLAAQVRAAGRLGEAEDTPETVAFLPADDLGQAGETLSSARHDVRRVLDESRPELEGLASEGEALRAALRQRPGAPRVQDIRRQIPALVRDVPAEEPAETPVDFEFTTITADDTDSLSIRARRPLRALLAGAATLGAIAVMGTALWMYRPEDAPAKSAGEPKAAERTSSSPIPKRPAANTTAATRAATTVNTRPGFVSLNVAAKRTSWIRVTVDGRVTAERIFKTGETQQVSNAREVSVRAGDAGAVTVSVDGRQATALGREGEVITRRFAAEQPRVRPTESIGAVPAPRPAVPVATAPPQAPAAVATLPPSPASAAPAQTTSLPLTPPARATETQAATPPPPTVGPSPASQPAATAARPAATSVDRTPATNTPVAQASLQDSLANTFARWLDAYYRQDRATMTAIAPQANVSDVRGDKERLPRGLTGVKRSLEDVKLQVVAPGALLTARMTERMETTGQMAQAVSFVSNIWEQRNGSWQLIDVRIVSASSLSKALR